jgi:hypothetical protein
MPLLISAAVAVLLLPVATVVVGMFNLRRHAPLRENSDGPAEIRPPARSRRRSSYPLPRPPSLAARSPAARLVRPFALKSQFGVARSVDVGSRE